MRYSPRFWASVCFSATLLLLILPWKPMVAAGNHVVFIVGGDVEWSLNSRPPTVRYHVIAGKGQPAGRAGQPYDSKLFQPFLMQGSSAQQLLESIRSRSVALDTAMEIDGNKGIITIPPKSKCNAPAAFLAGVRA